MASHTASAGTCQVGTSCILFHAQNVLIIMYCKSQTTVYYVMLHSLLTIVGAVGWSGNILVRHHLPHAQHQLLRHQS